MLVHHAAQVVLEVLLLAVLEALHLHEVRIGVVLQASGEVNEVDQRFVVLHLIPHRAVHSAVNPHDLLGHGYIEHVAVLQVVTAAGSGIHHIGVEVQVVRLALTGQLDVTHGTDGRGAASRRQGVERGVQCAQGEATLYADLAVDADRHGTRGCDGHRNLVLTERVIA